MNNFNDLFWGQISWTFLIGIFLAYLFGSQFAQRDSGEWEKTYWNKTHNIIKSVFAVLNFCTSVVFLYLTIDELSYLGYWGNYSTALIYFQFFMIFLVLGCYVLKFRPSPRGLWVKFRKCIGYYLIFSLFIIIGRHTIPIMMMCTKGDISTSYIFGNLFSHLLIIGGIFLLLKHYNREKYIPYNKPKTKAFSLKKKMLKIKGSFSIFMHNTKKLLAYYIGYMMIMIFILIIGIFNKDSDCIMWSILGSIMPIGIYWMVKLLNESKEQ